MKIVEENKVIAASKADEKFDIEVRGEGSAKIIAKILIQQLYADKQLAVVRETICNAVDAHLAAGIDMPISVWLPTKLSDTFEVRDYGQGLSLEEMKALFAGLGASTKRTSDAMIGGFGIGCKAPFCYSDVFTVTSHNNGTKSVYMCTATGHEFSISKVGEEPTTETGIHVSVPVKQDDHKTFESAAAFVAGWSKVPVEFRRGEPEIPKKVPMFKSGRVTLMRYDDGRYMYERQGIAVVNGVPYRCPVQLFSKQGIEKLTEHLGDEGRSIRQMAESITSSGCGWVVEFDGGELTFNAGREEIESTAGNVKAICQVFIDAIGRLYKTAKSLKDDKAKARVWAWAKKAETTYREPSLVPIAALPYEKAFKSVSGPDECLDQVKFEAGFKKAEPLSWQRRKSVPEMISGVYSGDEMRKLVDRASSDLTRETWDTRKNNASVQLSNCRYDNYNMFDMGRSAFPPVVDSAEPTIDDMFSLAPDVAIWFPAPQSWVELAAKTTIMVTPTRIVTKTVGRKLVKWAEDNLDKSRRYVFVSPDLERIDGKTASMLHPSLSKERALVTEMQKAPFNRYYQFVVVDEVQVPPEPPKPRAAKNPLAPKRKPADGYMSLLTGISNDGPVAHSFSASPIKVDSLKGQHVVWISRDEVYKNQSFWSHVTKLFASATHRCLGAPLPKAVMLNKGGEDTLPEGIPSARDYYSKLLDLLVEDPAATAAAYMWMILANRVHGNAHPDSIETDQLVQGKWGSPEVREWLTPLENLKARLVKAGYAIPAVTLGHVAQWVILVFNDPFVRVSALIDSDKASKATAEAKKAQEIGRLLAQHIELSYPIVGADLIMDVATLVEVYALIDKHMKPKLPKELTVKAALATITAKDSKPNNNKK